MKDFSRRRFVQAAGATGATAILAPGAAEALPPGVLSKYLRYLVSPYVRRNVAGMAANDPILVAYAAAITAMKALPSSDPRNWTNQATIHNNFCPHGNWFLLPWHRAYLLYFEQICRDLSGYPQFTLPYWDWTNHPEIPPQFWSGALNDPTRQLGQGQSVDPTGAFCGQGVIDTIMGYHDFEQQFGSRKSTATRGGTGGGQGTLESSPHNHVHSTILGDMGGYMSPLDPIFWLHHGNIDRIWAMWNLHNGNTTDPVWVDYQHPATFYDKNKASQPFVVKNMRSTYQNNYRYDTQPNQYLINIASLNYKLYKEASLFEIHQLVAVDRKPVSLNIPTNAAFRARATRLLATPAKSRTGAVVLTLRGVKQPEDPSTTLRVFINHPGPTADTPITDPHYAGSIAFFGPGMPGMAMDFDLDITKALAAISGKDGAPAAIQPQLVAIAAKGASQARSTVTAEKFDVGILEAQ